MNADTLDGTIGRAWSRVNNPVRLGMIPGMRVGEGSQ